MRQVLAALAALVILAPTAHAVDITACGAQIPKREAGVLLNDLVCTTELSVVSVGENATLRLNGFSISGADNIGIYCRGKRCTIEGPGEIRDSDAAAIFVDERTKLFLRDVDVRNVDIGVQTFGLRSKIDLTNVLIDNASERAISANKARLQGVTITGSAATGGWAMNTDRLRGDDVVVSNNFGRGIFAAAKLKVSRLTANGNQDEAIDAQGRVILIDSELTGNDAGGDGVDLRSEDRPKLRSTVCGMSSDDKGGNWGVCTND